MCRNPLAVSQRRYIFYEFKSSNYSHDIFNGEFEMNTISLNPTRTAREQRFENEQALFKASGLTVREFCRRHNISPSGFYSRRANSADVGARAPLVAPPELPNTAGFIDAGLLKKSKATKVGGVKARAQTVEVLTALADSTTASTTTPTALTPTALELRIDLGAGVVLTLTRR